MGHFLILPQAEFDTSVIGELIVREFEHKLTVVIVLVNEHPGFVVLDTVLNGRVIQPVAESVLITRTEGLKELLNGLLYQLYILAITRGACRG